MPQQSVMIYAPVPLHLGPTGDLLLEDQACNGLRLWAAQFDRVIAVLPLSPDPAPGTWRPLQAALGPDAARIEVIPLPMAWRLWPFLRALPQARAQLRAAMARADYLSFAIGGLIGDWGAVACYEAQRAGRAHAIWTDRVESQVIRHDVVTGPTWRRRLKARLTWRLAAWLERTLIRRADLGLFHGRETYETYAPYARQAALVHDIHLKREDHITPDALAAKMAEVSQGPLRIFYAGRVEEMKGAEDWLTTLIALRDRGISFEATWAGEGSQLSALREAVQVAGLSGQVQFPGLIRDRAALFAALRQAHLLLFCHKTPESPRILIEALVCGTPIVGYDSAFPRDLLTHHGGGALVPLGDTVALADRVSELAADRAALAALMSAAAQDGAPFEDREVFAHRAAVMRRYLPPKP